MRKTLEKRIILMQYTVCLTFAFTLQHHRLLWCKYLYSNIYFIFQYLSLGLTTIWLCWLCLTQQKLQNILYKEPNERAPQKQHRQPQTVSCLLSIWKKEYSHSSAVNSISRLLFDIHFNSQHCEATSFVLFCTDLRCCYSCDHFF